MDDLSEFAVESVELSPAVPLVESIGLNFLLEVRPHPRFGRPLQASVRSAPLLNNPPWVRSLGKLGMEVVTQGWRFPAPPDQPSASGRREPADEAHQPAHAGRSPEPRRTRARPPSQTVMFKDRLLYLLQPPLEDSSPASRSSCRSSRILTRSRESLF